MMNWARSLGTDRFWPRLDTEAEVRNLRYRIRVERVVEALAGSPASSARSAIVVLTTNAVFLSEPRRVDALIRATPVVRPAPPPVVAFWDRHSQPEDGYTNLTIRAMIENGSPPAIALFERKLLDTRHDYDEKVSWLRTDVLVHRADAPLLEGCERAIKGNLPSTLKLDLIDALFDYRPNEWYSEAHVYSPQDRSHATQEAQNALERIAEYALSQMKLTERQERAIESETGVSRESVKTR